MQTTREQALSCLLLMERKGSFSNRLLQERLRGYDARDAARVTRMVYGVLERKLTLEHLARVYTGKKPLEPEVRLILLLGFYQLLYQKEPVNAAVNETVKLCAAVKKQSAKGLVNAVLRRFLREGMDLKLPKDALKATAVRDSCPEELLRRWRKCYGGEVTEQMLQASFDRPRLCVRVNTKKTTTEALKRRLEADGMEVQTVPMAPNALWIAHTGNLEQNSAFQDGEFYVQDLSSQLCAKATGAKPGDVVLDLCAAPGSKSFTMALMMEDTGALYAYDQTPQKVRLIQEGAAKLGLSVIHAAVQDARSANQAPMADVVLCDVPCGGLGDLCRKPEVKYKDLAAVDALAPTQLAILQAGASRVKPGGRLVYSTCSLNPVENEEVVRAFLATREDFSFAPLPAWLLPGARVEDAMVTVFPQSYHSDGFFFALLQHNGKGRED